MAKYEDLDLGDLTPAEVRVKIGGVDFTLKEADGEAACQYRNALLKNTELGPNGKPKKVGNMADTEPLLVSLCLYNDEERRIGLSVIRKWPARIIKVLFAKCKEISQLDEEPEERKQLELVLGAPGSPMSFKELRDFVENTGGADCQDLSRWLEPSNEESAKNVPSSTKDG